MEQASSKECIKEGSVQLREHTQVKPPHLIPLTRWNDHHAWPPIGGLRHLAFNAKSKGCEEVFVRCGRKVLIDEKKFFDFIENQNKKSYSP